MQQSATGDRSLEEYVSIVGPDQIARLRRLAADFEGTTVLHVNSTAKGGGVVELLRSLVPVADDLGVDTGWLVSRSTSRCSR